MAPRPVDDQYKKLKKFIMKCRFWKPMKKKKSMSVLVYDRESRKRGWEKLGEI